jgi:hypothetical protein
MSRSQIDRLTRRIEALEGERKSRAQRVFTVLVRNHMRRDEEVARFRAEHGVTGDDLLIAQVIVPFQTLAHETAAAAYQREPWRETIAMGAKGKRCCRITGSARLWSAEGQSRRIMPAEAIAE